MEAMFRDNNFNQDIGGWNVENVTTFKDLFRGASVFDQDLGGWDISNATTLENFTAANAFNNASTNTINYWDTSNVTDLGLHSLELLLSIKTLVLGTLVFDPG